MKTILLADDDERLLNQLVKYLEESGFKVFSTINGKESLEVLERESVDLLVTDIVMPVMGGIELCRTIRKISKFKKLPIIMLTTMSDISDKYLGFTTGANDYITKPFEQLELLLRIQSLLNMISQADEFDSNYLSIKMNKNTHTIIVRNKEIYLSPLEFDMLYYLYSNPKRLISIEEFYCEVFKYPPDTGNPDNIRAHIKNIRSKIEENPNSPKIITNIPKRGYMFNFDV